MDPITLASGTVTVGVSTLTALAAPSQVRLTLFNPGTVSIGVGVYVKPSGGSLLLMGSLTLLPGELAWWPSALSRSDRGTGDQIAANAAAATVNYLLEGLQ